MVTASEDGTAKIWVVKLKPQGPFSGTPNRSLNSASMLSKVSIDHDYNMVVELRQQMPRN